MLGPGSVNEEYHAAGWKQLPNDLETRVTPNPRV
jgi:hypothetical protein